MSAHWGGAYRHRLDSSHKGRSTSGTSAIDTQRKLAGMQPVN